MPSAAPWSLPSKPRPNASTAAGFQADTGFDSGVQVATVPAVVVNANVQTLQFFGIFADGNIHTRGQVAGGMLPQLAAGGEATVASGTVPLTEDQLQSEVQVALKID